MELINEGYELVAKDKMSATIVQVEVESIENFEEMLGIANGTWNENEEFATNVQWELFRFCRRVFSGSFYVHKTFGAISVHR